MISTQPKFHNLLYKSMQYTKGLEYYTAEERANTKEHNIILVYIYGAILRNEIATDYLVDGLSKLNGSKYYRQEIKKAAKETKKRLNEYTSTVNSICNTDSLLDSLDGFKEIYRAKIKRHLDIMYFATLQTLDDQSVGESHILATLLMADTLMQIANGRLKKDRVASVSGRAVQQVQYLNLEILQNALQKLIGAIASKHKGTIIISNERTEAALHVLGEVLRDYNHILHTIEVHHD